MNMTSLTIKLLLLFTPGIVCFLIVESLVVHRTRKVHEVFLLTFIYGLLSYAVFAATKLPFGVSRADDGGIHISPPNVSMFRSLTDPNVAANLWEVALVTVLAVVLAIAVSFALNRYWFHDIARALSITRRFGQPNVWSFALNTDEVKWATVRDLQKNLMFQGYIRAFSDVEDPAELLLTRVCVYNEQTGKLLYEADHMYLARSRSDLTIEFPIVSH